MLPSHQHDLCKGTHERLLAGMADAHRGYAPLNMYALRKLVPDSHILFGSDYPFFLPSQPAKGLSDLKLPGEVRRAIERDNAARLLRRWNT